MQRLMMDFVWWLVVLLIGLALACALFRTTAMAQDAEPSDTADPAPAPTPVELGAYVEAYYQWNFNDPSNGITDFRGFDNRHDTFTLANVAAYAAWDWENVVGRLALQVGHTPSTYYLAEPERAGSNAANATGTELWKYVQEAYAGYRLPVGRGLTVLGGVFLSPIGIEGIAVKDQWNFSRSNLFFGLPFYHTGVRALYPLSDEWTVTLAAYNGWNSVVDNNNDKSISAQLGHNSDRLSFSLLYFGGNERAPGSPSGPWWRHDIDTHVTWTASDRLSLAAHGNVGFEPNRFGTSWWAAGALYARVTLLPELFLAVRADVFSETAAANDDGAAERLFWPTQWVSSATATVEYRPHSNASFRLEYRHDHAADDLYFAGDVQTDGTGAGFVPTRRSQDTLTAGITTWF